MNSAANDPAPAQSASAPLSAPTLEQSIRSHFAPTIRNDGFTGSGRVFQHLIGDMIVVIQIQGTHWGGSFAANLGIHPICIPVFMDVPLKKMRPEDCAFRRRLSEGGVDQWWDYTATKESMDAAIIKATTVYCEVGRPVLAKLVGPNSPFRTVTPEQFDAGQFEFSGFSSTGILMAKALALMRLAAGDSKAAKAFARIGLERFGPALGQLRELTAIYQGIWRREDW